MRSRLELDALTLPHIVLEPVTRAVLQPLYATNTVTCMDASFKQTALDGSEVSFATFLAIFSFICTY